MRMRFFCTAVAAAIVASVSAPARAQSEAEDRATARALAQQGSDALEAKDYAKAEDAFRRADALFHAPTLVLGLARAQAAEGKFVEAWENYNRIILENVTSTPVFAKTIEDAKREISTVEGRRSRVTVSVSGSSQPRVTLDDTPLKSAALGVPLFVNPGTHTVQASDNGTNPVTQTFNVAEGKSEAVALTVQSSPGPGVQPAAPSVPPPAPTLALSATPPPDTGANHPSRAPAIAAFAVGGAGLLTGIITGVVAIGDHSHLKTECNGPDGTCTPGSPQSDLSSYHTVGLVSTIGFVVAGVGAAAGITLWVLESKNSSPASAAVSPYLGVGSIGAVGRF